MAQCCACIFKLLFLDRKSKLKRFLVVEWRNGLGLNVGPRRWLSGNNQMFWPKAGKMKQEKVDELVEENAEPIPRTSFKIHDLSRIVHSAGKTGKTLPCLLGMFLFSEIVFMFNRHLRGR